MIQNFFKTRTKGNLIAIKYFSIFQKYHSLQFFVPLPESSDWSNNLMKNIKLLLDFGNFFQFPL